MRRAATGLLLASVLAPYLALSAQDTDSVELKRCMAGIELVAPIRDLQPDLVACLQSAIELDASPPALESRSRPAPVQLPDGRRYMIVGATKRDIYAELKGYPDETAIGHVGEELRRLACAKKADAILKARLSCGLCPERDDRLPCVFAEGYFVVWVDSTRE